MRTQTELCLVQDLADQFVGQFVNAFPPLHQVLLDGAAADRCRLIRAVSRTIESIDDVMMLEQLAAGSGKRSAVPVAETLLTITSRLRESGTELKSVDWSQLSEAVTTGLESLYLRETADNRVNQLDVSHEASDVRKSALHRERSGVSHTANKRVVIPATVKETHTMSSSTRTRPASGRAGRDSTFTAQFSALIENVPVAQFLVESDGSICALNKSARLLFDGLSSRTGFNADALESASIDLIVEAFPTLKKIAGGGGSQQIDVDGEVFGVSVTVNSSDESTIHTLNVLTEHVEQKNKLSEFSSLKSMLENMPTNVILADRNLTITYMNPASLRQLRELQSALPVPVDQIIGTSIDVFHRNPAHQRKMLADPANLPHRSQINVGEEILELLVTAVTNDQGTYVGPMVTWEVITGKLKSEAKNRDYQEQINSISQIQAVIEFTMDGTIVNANDNFLKALGYTLEEIRGQHHQMFVEPEFARSPEYREFWERLRRGESSISEFKRIGKGGRIVWIQANYAPIKDINGKPYKVVKFASDITASVQSRDEMVRVKNMMENITINVIMADKNLRLAYINPASRETLRTLQHLLPKPVYQLIGESVDIFHKNPEMQRRLLTDPTNLPHNARITLGAETLELRVSAIRDA